MRGRQWISVLLTVSLLAVLSVTPALAQEDAPAEDQSPDLTLWTQYPDLVVGRDETISLDLTLEANSTAQVVDLMTQGLPEGWQANFRGGRQLVEAVYINGDEEVNVDLRVEPPQDVEPGTYSFTVMAEGETQTAELPIEVTIQESVPASLSLDVELPTLRGRADSSFRYNVTLNNEGDEEITVDLLAESPPNFNVAFKSVGQEVTSIPVEPGGSERLTVEATPLVNRLEVGQYPITITARADDLQATTELTAEVVGQSSLNLTTPDGRVSGEAEAGQETSYTLVLQNNGSAPARNIDFSASSPNGWTVEYTPESIDELGPNQQIEVTANVQPAEEAIAGDYVVTLRALPENGATASVEYRITVRTSTLWGVVGVALIAVAVGVVALAVLRFGRR